MWSLTALFQALSLVGPLFSWVPFFFSREKDEGELIKPSSTDAFKRLSNNLLSHNLQLCPDAGLLKVKMCLG